MESPARIGKYEILEEIGSGGFAKVYRARDPFMRRLVAIKLCSSQEESLRARFLREAQIVGTLDHPHIARAYDFGTGDDHAYLVQEFLDGEDLSTTIHHRRPIAYRRRVELLLDVADGLSYAHSKGVLHRDIKPSNLRLAASGVVKILDFGLASLVDATTALTVPGTQLGTAGYLAPEQILGHRADERTDIFAFGATAYELLTYRRPFSGSNYRDRCFAVLKEQPGPVASLWPQCPSRLAELISGCLEKQAEARPATFVAIAKILSAVLEDPTLSAVPEEDEWPAPAPADDSDTAAEAPRVLPSATINDKIVQASTYVTRLSSLALRRLARLVTSRAGVLTLATAALVVVTIVVVLLVRREPRPEPRLAAPAPIPTVAPAVAPPPRGRLVVDARPWGEIVRIVDRSGQPIDLPVERFTPLVLDVLEGDYRATISGVGSEGVAGVECRAFVYRGSTGVCRAQLETVDAIEYFKLAGWWR